MVDAVLDPARPNGVLIHPMATRYGMSNIWKGLLAGLAATELLSVLLVLKAIKGVMPALDLPTTIAGMTDSPDVPMLGWAVHFMIGAVGYGIAMAILNERFPGQSQPPHGVVISAVLWLLMMVMVMPWPALACSDQRPPAAPDGTYRGAGGNIRDEGRTTHRIRRSRWRGVPIVRARSAAA